MSITKSSPGPALLALIFLLQLLPEITSTVCPGARPFLLEATSTCYAVCPWSAQTRYYAYSINNTCLTQCEAPTFAFDENKTCITTCPSLPSQTFYDVANRRCVNVCPSNYFGYLGPVTASNQICLQSNSEYIQTAPQAPLRTSIPTCAC